MKLTDAIFAYGTSEGVQKSWDTRGRGKSTRQQYDELVKKSDEEHKIANRLATEHKDFDAFKQHTEEAYRLGKEAMKFFDKLTEKEKQGIRSKALQDMTRAMFLGTK